MLITKTEGERLFACSGQIVKSQQLALQVYQALRMLVEEPDSDSARTFAKMLLERVEQKACIHAR